MDRADNGSTTKVILIDDGEIMREGIASALATEPDIEVVAEGTSRSDLAILMRRHNPDIALIDADILDRQWRRSVRRLEERARLWQIPVIMLAPPDFDEYVFHALRRGVTGFLLKTVGRAELVHAVRAVADGHAVICPPIARRLLDQWQILPPAGLRSCAEVLSTLNSREREVLCHIGIGLSNQEIADRLHLTAATVKTYVSSILGKLRLRDRVQAALFATYIGLTRPPFGEQSRRSEGQRALNGSGRTPARAPGT